MLIRLENEWFEYLLNQPETGMGYQFVGLTDKFNHKKDAIILNSELLIDVDYIKNVRKFSLSQKGSYRELLKAAYSSEAVIREIVVFSKSEFLRTYQVAQVYKSHGRSASDAGTSYTKKEAVFKRFSAFEDDHRVTEKNGLKPGTYTTTEEDARNVKTGVEAVLRYALPNDDPANKVFTIKPPERTQIKEGIVQPVDSKPGGGVEVIFVSGSPDSTVLGPAIIPER